MGNLNEPKSSKIIHSPYDFLSIKKLSWLNAHHLKRLMTSLLRHDIGKVLMW